MRVALLLLISVDYLAARSLQGPVVEVVVPHVEQSLARVFYHAESIAGAIYSEIGVRVVWRAAGATNLSCGKRRMHHIIVLEFSWSTSTDFHAGALAIALPYAKQGSCLTVFMDRLRDLAASQPTTAAYLIGHVLAHEMGHILQGLERHAATGLMSARWTPEQIVEMPRRRLRFTASDVALILAEFHAAVP